MQWESWQAFWAMGGAGRYVWGSYGFTLLLIAAELIGLVRRRKASLRALARWQTLHRKTGGTPQP